MLLKVLQATLALQAAILLTQALSAGLALAGLNGALDAHGLTGAVSLLVAIGQVATAVLLWRVRGAKAWLVAANIGFLLVEGVQAGAGLRHLWPVHVPLGVAIFGAALTLAIFARSSLPRALSDGQSQPTATT